MFAIDSGSAFAAGAMRSLGRYLARRRRKKRLGRAQLAAKAGCSEETIACLERATRPIGLVELLALARILGFDASKVAARWQRWGSRARSVPMTKLALIGTTFLLALGAAALGATVVLHDSAGHVVGTWRTDSNGTVTYYGPSGGVTAKAKTDANGNVTVYDKSNRVVGTVRSK